VTARANRVELWRGHRVVSVDGSGFSMSDTKQLQSLFHWAPGQRGHEFPVSKFVALFDLITGALLDLVPASMRDHELLIVQRLHDLLQPNDIVVADRLYCAYAYLAQLFSLQLHTVIRVPVGSRHVDFRPHPPPCRVQALEGAAVDLDPAPRQARSDRRLDQAHPCADLASS
jgi:hypothetical protein